VALVGSPMMNDEYMSTISGRFRRSSGSPPDRNTRCIALTDEDELCGH
jgi:hypothetical protein